MMNATHKETRQRNPEHQWLLCELEGKAWRNDGARVVGDRRRALCQVRTSALASPDNKEAKVPEETQYSSGGKRTCIPALETTSDSPGETPEVPLDPVSSYANILHNQQV